MAKMKRLPQLVLIVCLLATCWLAMQMVHEFGHCVGAWCTGGVVAKVVLRPWTISRTDLASNPDPLTVAWAGPVIGVMLPLFFWLMAVALRCPGAYLLRFFAGFCLIANGAYIGGGAFDRVGDAGDLQRHGSPLWLLFVFAVGTVPAGFWLWHRQSKHFGFGGAGGSVSRRDVAACVMALVLVLVLGFVLGSA